jgi:hypothetical protein
MEPRPYRETVQARFRSLLLPFPSRRCGAIGKGGALGWIVFLGQEEDFPKDIQSRSGALLYS